MAITILFLAILFALIGIGVGAVIVNRRLYSFRDIQFNSTTLKIGSVFLILINAHLLINMLKSIFSYYIEDLIVYDVGQSIQALFSESFSLAIVLLWISIGIFLLIRNFKFAFLASINVLIFTLFNSIFLINTTLIYAYISLLPTIAVLLSLLLAFVALNGKTNIYHRYSKGIKVAPYLILLEIVNNIISLIEHPYFNFSVVIGFAFVILEFLAFWLILNAMISFVTKKSTNSCEAKLTKKENLLITLSVLIFPAIIYFISSIDKTWLFAGGIVLAIFLPIALIVAPSKKSKVITSIITLAIVIAICLFAKAMPKNDEEFDPNKCYWCEGMGFVLIEEGGDLHRCSHCNGTGKR